MNSHELLILDIIIFIFLLPKNDNFCDIEIYKKIYVYIIEIIIYYQIENIDLIDNYAK